MLTASRIGWFLSFLVVAQLLFLVLRPDKPDAELTTFVEGWANAYDPRAKK